jgi:hypothetical protein
MRSDGVRVLSGTRYGGHRVTVGEDERSGRVRRHGEHEQGPSRHRRLPGIGPVVTVTVADRWIRWRGCDLKPCGTNTI